MNGENRQRLGLICRRWWDVVLLLVVSLFIVVVLAPSLARISLKWLGVLEHMHWILQSLVTMLIVSVFWLAIIRLGGFRLRDLLTWVVFVPVWLVAVVAAVVLMVMTCCGYMGGIVRAALCFTREEFLYSGALVLLGVLLAWVLSVRKERCPEDENESGRPDLDTWLARERAIEFPSEDILNARPVARRLTKRLMASPIRTVGVVGRYGSGKTSLLNLVRYYLSRESRQVLCCKVNAWRMIEGRAAGHVLRIAVRTISKRVDCIGLAGLPSEYQAAVSELAGPWASLVRLLFGRMQDPLEALQSLDEVLVAANLRLAIFVEDPDRTLDNRVFYEEVAALLDQLHRLKRVTFVLAINDDQESAEAVLRLCDHVEPMQIMHTGRIVGLIDAVWCMCRDAYPKDLDILSEKDRVQRLGIRSRTREYYQILGGFHEDVIEYMARLLPTPRLARSALASAWEVWQSLHGEIDIDDLFVACALRVGAREAYAFILANVEKLRALPERCSVFGSHDSEDEKKRREQMESIWEEAIRDVKCDVKAARNLVQFLFPGMGGDMIITSDQDSCQRVRDGHPTDYWRRLNAEELDAEELRDQDVLAVLVHREEDSGFGRYADMPLHEALHTVEGLGDKMEPFARKLMSGDDVRRLAHELFILALERDGVSANANECKGFINLWRLARHQQIDRGAHEQWVADQLAVAVPKSLRFANDIYYYWRMQEGGQGAGRLPRPELRKQFIATGRREFEGDPAKLLRALDPEWPYILYHFSVRFDHPEEGGTGFDPSQWKWLADIMVSAAEQDPAIMIPQLSVLLVNTDVGMRARYTRTFKEDFGRELFGAELPRVLTVLAEGVDLGWPDYEQRATIDFARDEARRLIAEESTDENSDSE